MWCVLSCHAGHLLTFQHSPSQEFILGIRLAVVRSSIGTISPPESVGMTLKQADVPKRTPCNDELGFSDLSPIGPLGRFLAGYAVISGIAAEADGVFEQPTFCMQMRTLRKPMGGEDL